MYAESLELLYQDNHMIAVRKPHGMLVHRTRIALDADQFAVQILRNQVGQRVYPVHRLDRKTEGILLFAKTREGNMMMQGLFRQRKVEKQYHAIVRGFTEDKFTVDYALVNGEKRQDAITHGMTVKRFEAPWPSGGFPTSRYSLVALQPVTGRYHQLRKHMAHIMHPIIGDRPHGCNKQNRLWKEQFGMTTMLLMASRLSFEYPEGNRIDIACSMSRPFKDALKLLQESCIIGQA